MRPIALRKNKLYATEEDPEGYQVIERYQINWESQKPISEDKSLFAIGLGLLRLRLFQ